MLLSSLFFAPSAVSTNALKAPWKTAEINYSAANRFCRENYGREQYFPCETTAEEPIFNGRLGVLDDDSGRLREASLASCGFALCASPDLVSDWSSLPELKQKYLPELAKLITAEFEGHGQSKVAATIFWNPMLRGEGWGADGHDEPRASPRGPIAAMCHIDTDMNTFRGQIDDLVRMIERNRVEALLEGQPPPGSPLVGRGRELADSLQSGRRFAIVNAWRNVDRDSPVLRAPLAVMATRYPPGTAGVVPTVSPCMERSRWYVFPRMTSDEVLLFTQFDRSAEHPGDTWHSALPSVAEQRAAEEPAEEPLPPRRSFEVRCLVVFEEMVEHGCDRFSGYLPRLE